MPTRRDAVRSTLAFAAAGGLLQASAEAGPATLRLVSGKPLAIVPRDFIGLGYEESSVARVGLLSADNAPYVQLVRNLGPGVLRAGGIVADFTSYSPDGVSLHEPKNTVITRANLQQLRGFLDAVNWRAIVSVNFGRGTLGDAIVEARDAAHILGSRLLALELGNEVENYRHGKTPLRAATYSYEDYRAEYSHWREAILAAVPGVAFAAPDTAASVEWVERMAADASGDVQLLTTHYYRGDQRQGTREQLLEPDADLKTELERLRRASTVSGIPWRMCEINSFFGGGRPGLSDTLAGALWTLDTMLLLAGNGCAGVNMETGVNQLGSLSSYSPIRDDETGGVTAGVPYYGMLAFAQAVAGAPEMIAVALNTGGLNVTSYALGRAGSPVSVVLINKSADQSLRVSLEPLKLRRGSVTRLAGRSIESGEGVTLGGEAVDASGRWVLRSAEPLGAEVVVAAASAVVIRAAAAVGR